MTLETSSSSSKSKTNKENIMEESSYNRTINVSRVKDTEEENADEEETLEETRPAKKREVSLRTRLISIL